eukprot:9617532-Alexandrium_andersonii.AAC.1
MQFTRSKTTQKYIHIHDTTAMQATTAGAAGESFFGDPGCPRRRVRFNAGCLSGGLSAARAT